MKKLLAMVLALVMTLSLAVSANAAFEDAKDINETYAEAIDVLAGLKVFQGYDNGKTFKPQGDITRAEVAAIVYRISTGDVTDKQAGLYASYNKFSDMNGAGWAAGYIGYCANAELVKGYPDGTFKPSGKVTGYEVLAMILRAVGYDKQGEFSGSAWQLHVAEIAQKNGILDNVKGVDLNKAASRELVAELLFEAINVPMVTYTAAFGYQTVSLTADKKDNFLAKNETLGHKTFGLAKVSGEISGVDYIDNTTDFLAAKATKAQTVLDVDAGFENIGYEGYVWAVPGAKTSTLTAVSTVYVTGESLGSSTNGTEYATLTDKNDDAFIDLDKNVQNAKIYKNGEVVSSSYTLDSLKADLKKVGVKVDFVDNDADGKTDVIVVTEYTVAQVAGVAKDTTTGNSAVAKNTFYFSVYNGTTAATKLKAVKAEALACDDELAVKDYITFVDYNGATYAAKAALVTDTFNRIKYDTVLASKKVVNYVVGETEYIESAKKIGSALDVDNLNKKLDLYTDSYGHVIFSQLSKADVDYLYVLANRHTDGLTKLTDAKVVFSDGKVDTVAIKAVDGNKNFDTNSAILEHIYSYTVNSNESYTLKLAHTGDMTDGYYTAKEASWVGKVDGKEVTLGVNLNTKVIDLRDEDKIEVYTGYEKIPSLSKAEICYIANAKGVITLAYLTDGINTEDLTSNLVVYTTGATVSRRDPDTNKLIYNLAVIADGEAKTVELTEDQYNAIQKLGVGEYYFNKNGSLKKYISFDENWTSDVSWEAGTIKVNNAFKVIGDDVNYCILNISTGGIYDLTKVDFGSVLTAAAAEGKAVHAYLKYNETETALTQLYIVIGDQAAKTGTPVTGTNADKVYYVENFKVTRSADVEKVLKAADFVSEVKFNSYTAELKSGAGTKADPFKMVATGCIEEASQMSTLKVTAPLTNMTIVAGVAKDFSDSLQTAKGILDWTTQWNVTAKNYNSFRVTNADGDVAYFEVTFSVLSHNATPTDKTPASVHVDGTSIKVSSTYSQETTLTEAQLLAQLTLPEGATASYADGKLTVTAECGRAVEYTVAFVEGAATAAKV